jgi:hypothetical protein
MLGISIVTMDRPGEPLELSSGSMENHPHLSLERARSWFEEMTYDP